MTEFFRIRPVIARMLVRIVFAMGLCGLNSCQPPASTNGASSAARVGFRQTNAPVRDLSHDEAAGGHILRKHVGQTDAQLRERLEQERHITGASTYTDRATAEHAVGAAIAQSQGRIQQTCPHTLFSSTIPRTLQAGTVAEHKLYGQDWRTKP